MFIARRYTRGVSIGPAVAIVLEASDAPVSVELQRAYFADIASRYPGWSPDLHPECRPGRGRRWTWW